MEQDLIDYFIERTDERFDKLEDKVDTLLAFKWQIIGGSVIFSAFLTLVFQTFFFLMER